MGRSLSWGSGELSAIYQVPPVCQTDCSCPHFTVEKVEAQEINSPVHSRTTVVKSLRLYPSLVPTISNQACLSLTESDGEGSQLVLEDPVS